MYLPFFARLTWLTPSVIISASAGEFDLLRLTLSISRLDIFSAMAFAMK